MNLTLKLSPIVFVALVLFTTGGDATQTPLNGEQQDKNGKQALRASLKKWEKNVREQIKRKPEDQKLLAKYPLVLLTSRFLFAKGDYAFSAYSFIDETNDPEKHNNDVHLLFMNGNYPFTFQWNMTVGQENLVVDLGKWNFEKDPNPKEIKINHPKVFSSSCKAQEGHIYLQWVRDDLGNNFYVLFKVVALEPQSRYMAFIWRKLPGGKVVKRGEKT